jgi:two-component system response regulator HydG
MRVIDGDAPVLITGESGTGKELVARAIHKRSERGEGPFIAVNCAAMPPNLLESELFGHVRGAFTDAKRSHDGLFVQASGGTLFLDEIGEMPLEMQPKLLRALEERSVRPIGGTQNVSFDTRIIAATNRDLETDVEDGRFREDLFYRIDVVRIHVPPLRSRGNDVLLLAQHFLERVASRAGKAVTGFTGAAAQRLLEYDWPGNVRELQNFIERAVTLTRFEEITVDDLPKKIRNYHASQMVIVGDDPEQLMSLEELERRYIQRVLKAVTGNKTQAARVLGLDRRTLYRKLKRYGSA